MTTRSPSRATRRSAALTARQIEARARPKAAPPPVPKPRAPDAPNPDVNLRALEHELETLTGMRSAIAEEDGTGSVTFVFTDLDQIDELLRKLRR